MIGVPLLLSKDMSGTELLRISMQHDPATQSYQERFRQEVIDRWPNILPICDFYPSVTGVCSLGREIPVQLGGTEGFIDYLLVTDDGRLVIVETKLWRNPEAMRDVIAQTFQYAMAVTEIPLDEFETRIRRGDPKGQRLGNDETVLQRACKLLAGKSDDFEEVFDRLRQDGEILLLIVADAIRASVERLVDWMNKVVGSSQYKLGLVELELYGLPDGRRVIIPKTLLRTREASRHVITSNFVGDYAPQNCWRLDLLHLLPGASIRIKLQVLSHSRGNPITTCLRFLKALMDFLFCHTLAPPGEGAINPD